jgi:biopolymer transport protein ExbB/TolQ
MLTKKISSLIQSLDLSFLLGLAGTVGFYAFVMQPHMHGTLLHRYTAEHPVEYVIVWMFIWGSVDIALKALAFPREFFAVRAGLVPPRNGREPVSQAAELLAGVKSRARWLLDSRIGQRILKSLEHVVENGSGDDYREHVKYLADKAEDDRYARYTLVRFIIGVTPILGFLGTVVHFGTALSGISFDQMADRLSDIVSEMGQAFNTTTAALAASMSMMFAMFLCERIEIGIDRHVERFAEHELLNRFETHRQNLSPFLAVVQSANEEALRSIGTTLDRQVGQWSESLDRVFQRFDERDRHAAAAWEAALLKIQERQFQLQSEGEARVAKMLGEIDQRQAEHALEIRKSLEGIVLLRNDVRELGQNLSEVAEGEGRLWELQQVLTNNLRVLHETQQIDDALHGLTAAIHLLTTRHKQGTPPGAAAA